MAKEYIDREEFMENVRLKYCKDCTSYNGLRCGSCWVDDMEDAIEDAPIADVAEVRHGRWIDSDDGNRYCSECGKSSLFFDSGNSFCRTFYRSRSNYCPNCGAKMDGKDGADNG